MVPVDTGPEAFPKGTMAPGKCRTFARLFPENASNKSFAPKLKVVIFL